MPAPRRNRFAAKPPEQRHREALFVRLTKSDKARIVEAAGEDGLAAWARKVLLKAVEQHDGEPIGPASGSQPRRPDGNRTSAAAGSRR